MEDSAELESILPYLPLVIGSSRRLLWPSKVVEALEAMSRGPDHSRVNCGEVLSIAISDMRASLSLADPLALSAPLGYALFFYELMSGADSRKWFAEDIPKLANLLLRLPSLLEVHYQNSRAYGYGLRILGPQQPGMVLLSQVHSSGLIEDHAIEALEVDFANKYLGGGALHRGCVQVIYRLGRIGATESHGDHEFVNYFK